jgi:epidermal growth factor receptor substrate 15
VKITAQRHPNLNLTPEEKRVFYQLFQAADTTNLGVITGEIAVPFFEKTHLPSGTLGEVRGQKWRIQAWKCTRDERTNPPLDMAACR